MALTTLTPTAQWDDVKVPNNGTKMVAVSATDPPPNDEGPVRQAFQQLVNRTKWLRDKILDGTRSFKGLVIDGTGDQTVAPPAGSLSVSGSATIGGGIAVTANATIGAVCAIGDRAIITTGTDLLTAGPASIAWTGTTAAANPAHTVSVANKVLPINTPKVGGSAYVIGGVVAAGSDTGFGWTTLTTVGTELVITFTTPFDNVDDQIIIVNGNKAGTEYQVRSKTRSTTLHVFSGFNGATGGAVDMTSGEWRINFVIYGKVTT